MKMKTILLKPKREISPQYSKVLGNEKLLIREKYYVSNRILMQKLKAKLYSVLSCFMSNLFNCQVLK